MQPYEQDMRVTYRRMTELTRRSQLVQGARLARSGAAHEAPTRYDTGELVSVVSLDLTERACCDDERIAS